MRKLIIGAVLLCFAATAARAADLREFEPDDDGPPQTHMPAPPRYVPEPDDDDDEPPVHAERGYRPWREGGWREGYRSDERWGRRHREHCGLRPTPWGPEPVCR